MTLRTVLTLEEQLIPVLLGVTHMATRHSYALQTVLLLSLEFSLAVMAMYQCVRLGGKGKAVAVSKLLAVLCRMTLICSAYLYQGRNDAFF